MGTVTNSKRTVTVQLVPQPAAVDCLGNKEANSNLENEPNHNVLCMVTSEFRQDSECSKTPSTSTANKCLDNSSKVEVHSSHANTSEHSDPKQHKPIIGKEPQKSRDPSGQPVNDVSESYGDSNANSSTLTSAKKRVACKTSPSSPATASKVDLPKDNGREELRGSKESLIDLKAQNVRKDTSKDLVKCDNKVDAALKSCSPDLQHRISEVPTDRQENADNSGITGDVKTQLSFKMKGGGNVAGLSSAPVISPDSSNNPPLTSKVGSTVMLSGNHQKGQHENADESTNSLSDRKSLGTSYLAQVTEKSISPVLVKEAVKSLGDPKPSSLQDKISAVPQSNPAARDVKKSKTPPNCVEHKAGYSTGMTAVEQQLSLQDHAKEYKEAATMTASVEGCLPSIKACQDAEVQAVADVHSRSAGTSPLMLPVGASHKPCGAAKSDADTLTVFYQKNTRSAPAYQMTLDNSQFRGSSVACDTSIQSFVTSQIHAGLSQCTGQTAIDRLPEKVRLEAGLCASQNTTVIQCLGSSLQQNISLGAKPKEPGPPLCNAQKALPPLQPVYQINIESCSQSHVPPNTVQEDTKSSQCSSALEPHSSKPKVEGSDAGRSTKPPVSSQASQVLPDTVTWPAQAAKCPAVKSVSTHLERPQQTTLPCKRDSGSKADDHLQGNQIGARKEDDVKQVASHQDNRTDHKVAASQGLAGLSKSGQEPGRAKLELEEKKEPAIKPSKPKTVHDVVWDEQGMTWEVYGASVDPESLGFAIQSHLQSKIKEHERLTVARSTLRKSISDEASPGRKAKRGQRNMFRSMLRNVRRPNCCSRPPPSSVLE